MDTLNGIENGNLALITNPGYMLSDLRDFLRNNKFMPPERFEFLETTEDVEEVLKICYKALIFMICI